MKISRSNYEVWFADWLDNNLNKAQVDELNAFLEENPDLLDEFNELGGMKLQPAELLLPGKVRLFRHDDEMEQGQFELLCAAAAEGDLEHSQIDDFREMLEGSSDRQKTAEIFRKLKLEPENISFPGKKSLLQRTGAQTFVSIGLPVLAAAAVFVLVFIALKPRSTEMPLTADALEIRYDISHKITSLPEDVNQASGESQTARSDQSVHAVKTVPPDPPAEFESTASEIVTPQAAPFMATTEFLEKPSVEPSIVTDDLVASTISYFPAQSEEIYSERSRLGRLLAFKFREKILKEELPEDTPIRAFEIAEAGVTGLNKLLGWEMALSRSTDEKGEAGSVRFSSRLIKFSTPVKNESVAE